MNVLLIVLRLVHIIAGVFWVGGGFFNAIFLTPAIAATGDAGQKMMGHMMNQGRMSVRLSVAAILTVLAGLALYWIDSAGLSSSWTTSATGWGFGLGGLFGIIGMGTGIMVGRNAHQLGVIGAAAQGKPTQGQMLELQAVQKRMALFTRISTTALVLALICMATARYWGL